MGIVTVTPLLGLAKDYAGCIAAGLGVFCSVLEFDLCHRCRIVLSHREGRLNLEMTFFESRSFAQCVWGAKEGSGTKLQKKESKNAN